MQTDPNGLLYMRARYYNPYICRFINADPSGFGGGLNMYAFADGNPVSNTDPFGLGALEAATGGTSWVNQALQGTQLGDWANGFSRGLDAYANGEDLSKYTATGSDAYQQGQEAGVGAVPGVLAVTSLALAVISDGTSLEAEFALGLESESVIAAEGTMATQEGLIEISEHLTQLPGGGGIDPANASMYSRLTTAFENGQALTGADEAFYQHELLESSLMDTGMDARAAHLETLNQQGIPYAPGYEAQLYHPTVIQQFPSYFSPAAQAAAGVH